MLATKFKNPHPAYHQRVIRRDGSIEEYPIMFNSRPDKGAALMASLLAGESLGSITSPLPPKYLALSTSTLTPAKGDTTLAGETSATGLARAVGTIQNYIAPTSLDAQASYDIYKEFTNNSGGAVTITAAGVFDASSSGNLFSEANITSVTLQVGDKLQLTVTVPL